MTNCVHHWRINEECYGTCIKCGEEKQFARELRESYINYDKLKDRSKKGTHSSHKERMKAKAERKADKHVT